MAKVEMYSLLPGDGKSPEMDREGVGLFANHESMFVSQTRKGCIKECLGCEQNNEVNDTPTQPPLAGFRAPGCPVCPHGRAHTACAPHPPAQFNIYAGRESQKGSGVMYALESASCPCRFFCKAQRTSHMDITTGDVAGGAPIMSYDRPFRCMPSPCKCCCYQEMTFYGADGTTPIGMIKEDCFYCTHEPLLRKDLVPADVVSAAMILA